MIFLKNNHSLKNEAKFSWSQLRKYVVLKIPELTKDSLHYKMNVAIVRNILVLKTDDSTYMNNKFLIHNMSI